MLPKSQSACSCGGDTCTCCCFCDCKPAAKHVAPGKNPAVSIDGLKEIGVAVTKLHGSVDAFPKTFSVEVQAVRDAGYVAGGTGALIGLLVGLIVGMWLAGRK